MGEHGDRKVTVGVRAWPTSLPAQSPPALQPKLLRVLHEQEFERLGDHGFVPVVFLAW
jgi:hypothetical protein